MKTRSLLPFVLAALVAHPLLAQADPALFPGFDPDSTTRAFLAQSGPHWRVTWSPERGTPALIFGGARAAVSASQAQDAAALEAAARKLVNELAPALGFDASTLQLLRVRSLAHLAAAGTTPKSVVEFRQVVSGVPVHHATVHVLFDHQGRLLALDNAALPHVSQAPLAPELSEAAALGVAAAAFARDTGLVAASFEPGDYVLFPEQLMPGKPLVRATAAYVFRLDAGLDRSSGATPVIRSYAIAAVGAPRVLGSWSHVHSAGLSGNVQAQALPGLYPLGSGPLSQLALKDVRVTGSGPLPAYTADNGDFSLPGTVPNTLLSFSLDGQWSSVNNAAGASTVISKSASPGVPIDVAFNTPFTEQQTAEVSAHRCAEIFRDWLRSVDPAETMFDFQQQENVNIADTCNAYYDGASTNYYLAGGGCVNTAYSTVVWHEVGHWANDLFGTYNGGDGMGEGAADCWSMYVSDNPVLGQDFFGIGSPVRTGLNTSLFCGDDNPACYGEVHADGEPLMGAIWKVRAQLEAALGGAAGGNVANHLLVGWFQSFDDMQIKSVIEEHWLVLDDDDGNIDNGTPHEPQINAGFTAQGFPGFVLPMFLIQHVPLTIVNSELPVPIQAVVTEQTGILTGVTLGWFDENGNLNPVAMSPLGGNVWRGFVPGQVSPKTVRYFIEANGITGNTLLPKSAPTDTFLYDVGSITTQVLYDFEPVSDEGWTHAVTQIEDDWQHGAPQGKSTDPPAAFSGTRCWGNDLGVIPDDGKYTVNVANDLLSPVFNFTGKTGLRLRYRRWLGVEESTYDQAEIWVNATRVYVNPPFGHVIDKAWTQHDIAIGALADNNPSVQFKFALTSDGGLQFGGWNIDDFSVVSLGPVTPTGFVSYGTGLAGTAGKTPLLAGSGLGTPGGSVTISISNGKAGAPGALIVGVSAASLPFKGGSFLVGPPFLQIPLTLGAAGTATLIGTVPTDPSLYGLDVFHQYWCSDAGAVKGKAGSKGLTYTIL